MVVLALAVLVGIDSDGLLEVTADQVQARQPLGFLVG